MESSEICAWICHLGRCNPFWNTFEGWAGLETPLLFSYPWPSYTYLPLSSARAVRVPRLDKTKDIYCSLISCCLVEVDFDDPSLQYQALSYVWGDAQLTSTIFVNGKEFVVRVNLRDALFELRTDTPFRCNLACAWYKAPGPPPLILYSFHIALAAVNWCNLHIFRSILTKYRRKLRT